MAHRRSPTAVAAVLLAGLTLAAAGAAQEKTSPTKAATAQGAGISAVRTEIPVQDSERQVLGSRWRTVVQQARNAVSQGRLDAAVGLLAPAIADCDRLTQGGRSVVSVASAEQYQAYVEARGGGTPVDWIDMACPEAYDMQAFVDVDRRQFGEAEALLGKAIALAPYWAEPVVELGAAYNQSGRPGEALANYQRALDLIERYQVGNAPLKAMALRGIGFAQVELGDLDAAEAAYRSALELVPDSQVAENELEYIRQQREAAKP